jgi:hypothetical protein
MVDLQLKGVIKQDMSSLGQVSRGNSFLDKYNQKGMIGFQATDIINRMAAYFGAKTRFTDGYAQFQRGEVNFETFRKSSRMVFLEDADQAAIIDTLRRLGPDAAGAEYGLRFSRFTQGTYENWHNPIMMRSTVGRLFGMFSHYPTMYLNFVKNVIVRSPIEMKLAVIPTLTAMTGAVIALHNATQTRSDSYLPMGQMLFLGGPVSDIIGETLSTMDEVIAGRQDPLKASGTLLTMVGKVFIPGSAIYRSYEKAIRAYAKGDSTAFFNFIITAPYVDTTGEYK